ncbi:hypothetical protein BRC84_04275 [Halobacteriales archaeon QS_1_68_44]|nr:MAG: hypothetical protein BRC84_04275 [Halobacteriales archaeon QS_1_68_44]
MLAEERRRSGSGSSGSKIGHRSAFENTRRSPGVTRTALSPSANAVDLTPPARAAQVRRTPVRPRRWTSQSVWTAGTPVNGVRAVPSTDGSPVTAMVSPAVTPDGSTPSTPDRSRYSSSEPATTTSR